MRHAVRPARLSDVPAINALHREVWWPQRSAAGWRWLAEDPARAEIDAPFGWVVDGPDGPQAFLGNLIQRFRRGDEVLHGATGFSIIVPPRARGAGRALLNTFVEQPGVFARYTLNANPRSRPLYPRHGMHPWPAGTHDLKLSWIVDPVACARGWALRRLLEVAPRSLDFHRERLMNPRLGAPPSSPLPPGVARLTDLGDRSRFADFWTALVAEGRLVADRGLAVLRRRLADPDLTAPPTVLAYNRGRGITGYALAMPAKGNAIEPPMLEIVDLIALDGEAEAIPALMQALVAQARSIGAAKLRLQALSPRLLAQLGPWAARARREGGWGHAHARFDGPIPDDWSPTPYDGDYAVCLRPVPIPRPITASAATAPRPAPRRPGRIRVAAAP